MENLNILAALPEIALVITLVLVLLGEVIATRGGRAPTIGVDRLALIAILAPLFATISQLGTPTEYAFYGMYVSDEFGRLLKLCAYIAVGATLLYARAYVADREMYRGEFYTLALFALLGQMVMISANNLLVVYLGLELMSLSLYALAALRRDHAMATEAAIKYYVLGALASGFLLYGMSMIYGGSGSLDLPDIAKAIAGGGADRTVLVFGVVFIVAGLAFKFGAVPFHMWVPDVYHGAPTAVTLFLSSAPKLASFALAYRLLAEGLAGLADGWQDMLIVVSVLSMAIGNVVAIAQTNLKRMLAYSTISHVGFILLGILAGTSQGYESALYYTIAYVIMSVGGFGMIILLSRAGFEADSLEDFKGLNARSPWFAAVMLMLMFSMAGVPPFIGFWAKLAVIQAVLDVRLLWLAVVAVVFSVIGAYYYLRVVKLMYFDEPVERRALEGSGALRFVLSVNGLAVLVLGMFPGLLLAVCAAVIP